MMTEQIDHSEDYSVVLEAVTHPKINFVEPIPESEKPQATKWVLHQFVNHHYMQESLTEAEADDLHRYIEERTYA